MDMKKISEIKSNILARHIGRQNMVDATLMGMITGYPVFFLGPPGVDKTGTIRDISASVGAIFYDMLMTTIVSSEQMLVEKTVIRETVTADGEKIIEAADTLGRAAAAHIVFADEIWKARPAVLQTLLDLALDGIVRHQGQMIKTPLLAFFAASNELPAPGDQLEALWSRMTLRVQVPPLDAAGKRALAATRRPDYSAPPIAPLLTIEDINHLRAARARVAIPNEIVETVLEIYQKLLEKGGFDWLWADDRRLARTFNVLQAAAVLAGRSTIIKADLAVLEFMLWDRPDQIAAVRGVLAPYCRTAIDEAQSILDALLAPGGMVALALRGGQPVAKLLEAVAQCQSACNEIERICSQADSAEYSAIEAIRKQAQETTNRVLLAATGGLR